MSKPIANSDATYSEEQTDLFSELVKHFGAVDARELDLGTLMVIRELVVNGSAPGAPERRRSSAPAC